MQPEQVLRKAQVEAEALLGQATSELDAKALFALVRNGIQSEYAARDEAHGARSTFVLNGLLAIEQQMWTQVFGMPRQAIIADPV